MKNIIHHWLPIWLRRVPAGHVLYYGSTYGTVYRVPPGGSVLNPQACREWVSCRGFVLIPWRKWLGRVA